MSDFDSSESFDDDPQNSQSACDSVNISAFKADAARFQCSHKRQQSSTSAIAVRLSHSSSFIQSGTSSSPPPYHSHVLLIQFNPTQVPYQISLSLFRHVSCCRQRHLLTVLVSLCPHSEHRVPPTPLLFRLLQSMPHYINSSKSGHFQPFS